MNNRSVTRAELGIESVGIGFSFNLIIERRLNSIFIQRTVSNFRNEKNPDA